MRRWLSKGRLQFVPPEDEMLYTIAELMHQDASKDGLAALHFWGQTGDRSGAWMAAADPVHLEARLDHLFLHDLRGKQMPMADLRSIFDFLQDTFGSDRMAFARIGHQGYLRGAGGFATAKMSAIAIDGRRPDEFMPKQGDDGAADDHHRLLSEVQMALHQHVVNDHRQESGMPEVNSLWIWGGGTAPEVKVKPMLPLFSNDPLLKGFWLSRTGIVEPWADDFGPCIALAQKGFVAIAPQNRGSSDRYLLQLKSLMASGKIGRLTVIFRDGLRAEISSRDAFRFWRRESPLVKPQ